MNLESVLPRFFEESGGHIVLGPDNRVVSIGPEYLRLTNASYSLVGEPFLSSIVDPDPERRDLVIQKFSSAIDRARETGETVKLPELRNDIIISGTNQSREKWWRVAFIPVKDSGSVEYVVHRIEDVTIEQVTSRALSTQRKANYILYTFCVAVIVIISIVAWAAISGPTREACLIQAQSLPAQHELSHVMADAAELINVRPNPVTNDMEAHLHKYLDIEKKLPDTRKC